MYVVSCRRGFDSSQLLSSENQYRNYTNPANPAVFQELNKTQILEQAADKHVAILVHGFNNETPDVMRGYWRVVTQLKDTGVTGPKGYGLVLGFSWPGFSTSAGYFTAAINAKKASVFLIDLINSVRAVAHTVDVQTHSLGARVALQALKNPNKTFVDNLLLSAPAVDNHVLEPDKDFNSALDSCNRCLVYHSQNDKVLKLAFPLGDISDGLHKALGAKGPRSKPITLKSPNLYVVDCSARVHDHSGYKDAKQYFQHWAQVLSGGPLSRYDELS